jgi:hypothetical protein
MRASDTGKYISRQCAARHADNETISYGAPYVCDQLSDKGICSAGAFAHPAFLKEHHFENLKSEFSEQAIRI